MIRREGFVTAGLCKIKDQIAEAAKNPAAGKTAEIADEASAKPVSFLESLPEETRKAILARQQEIEQFRRDLLFRLHETAAKTAQTESDSRKRADSLLALKNQLDALMDQLERQQEPDEFSPDFQIQLSDNFRKLEKMRLELIEIQAAMPESSAPEAREKTNLLADLDSVTFGQLFRLGWAFFLPLILTVLLGLLLLAVVIIFTFRFGL
ncbi:MAG: hypothetical protein J5806_05025 [Lentisphaeria bacterium]|nr:hypothetical protein [Lentisphaeria bacterium]